MTSTIIKTESEGQWLAARQGYVTATDIARLAHGGPAAWQAVKDEKAGVAPGFRGNAYTEYGHEREPFIAAHVAFLFDLTHNATQDLYVHEGTNYAATPDMTGPRLGEIKTTVTDWLPDANGRAATGTDLAALPGKYLDQVWWAQFVADVDETVFAWEPHEHFIPGPVRTLVIPRNDDRIAALLEVAAQFATFRGEKAEPGEFDTLLAVYAEKQRILDEAAADVAVVKAQIEEQLGGRDNASAATPFASLSYYLPKPAARFDQASFKKAHPDLAKEYTREVPASKPTLRITVKD